MKEQTYFHIPTPCHENWDNMTQQDKGRFCASCNKQVVDFSLMSDQQVLNYFKNATGRVCGRFANDQLQRPMTEALQQKKKVWWVAAMMPLLLLFGKANAQKKNKIPQRVSEVITPDTIPILLGKIVPAIRPVANTEQVTSTEKCFRTTGDTIITTITNDLIIKGMLTETGTGAPLPYASVLIKNSKAGVASDANGNFTLKVKNAEKLPTVVLAYVGYETKEIDLNKESTSFISTYQNGVREITIKSELTKMQTALLGDVIVTAGVIVTCKKPKRIDTTKTVVKKILKKETFKIFPNPVEKGSILKLEIKKAGEYSVQVLDNNAGLILIQNFSATNDNSLMEITIPSYVIPGMYYIRLIDENKKKQYTDKLVVQ